MAKFTFQMVETRAIQVTYVVEANDYDEACQNALQGDTIDEYATQTSGEVINREII